MRRKGTAKNEIVSQLKDNFYEYLRNQFLPTVVTYVSCLFHKLSIHVKNEKNTENRKVTNFCSKTLLFYTNYQVIKNRPVNFDVGLLALGHLQ